MPEGSDNKRTADPAVVASEAAHGGTDTAQAFISYASADRSTADAVCAALEREGARCWIAPRDVTPGELYSANIVHAIDTTRVVVLVLSQHAADSAHVLREVERAASKRHPILSFRIDQAPLPEGLEYFLNSSQWLDASITGVDRALPKLVDAVKGALGKPTVAARDHQSQLVPTNASKRPTRALLALVAIIAAALAYVGVDRLWLSKHDGAQSELVEATPASPSESSPAMSANSAKAIAVLPFLNLSSDKEQEYFSDGLSEELLNLLAKVPELRVAARTSSFYYKGKDVKLTDVARELQVAHLLEGSVRKSGNRVRITAQLIRASDGYHQWSETYDRTLEDIFAVQEEIAAAVVSQLKIKLLSAPPKVRETNPEAYALYLQAQEIVGQQGDRADKSIALYQRSLAIDPNYAPAWIGLGYEYAYEVIYGLRPRNDGTKIAREAIGQALAIDPDYAEAHALLGWLVLKLDHDLAASARHLERALALDPRSLVAIGVATQLNVALGREHKNVEIAEYFLSRDPMVSGNHTRLGHSYLDTGRLDGAIASFRAALTLAPDSEDVHAAIADALLLKGEYEAAIAEYKKERVEPKRLAGLASAYHALRQNEKSNAALGELIEKYPNWAVLIAITFADRDEFDRAFEWLQAAVTIGDSDLMTVPESQWLKSLHDDPRWLPFLRKIGMAPERLAAIKFELKVPTH